MDQATLGTLFPVFIVAITFGCPVLWVAVSKYFKLRDRELTLEAASRDKWTDDQRRMFEQRLATLEAGMSALLHLLPQASAPQPLLPQQPSSAATGESQQPALPQRTR